MPHSLHPYGKKHALQFNRFFQPVHGAMNKMLPLEARGNRPLQMNFEDHLRVLVYFHLQEHTSARHLLQELEEDEFARRYIAPPDGIRKSSFSEATNTRGLDQFMSVFENLQEQAAQVLPHRNSDLGNLVAVDGSLISATLSMHWADYRKGANKAKAHIGFDLNRGIPRKIFLTRGTGAERPFVGRILSSGDTGVIDRGYQCHEAFDRWQDDELLFMCRIKAKTVKTVIEACPVASDGIVFYDALVLLGTAGINQTKKPLRLVGYEVDNVRYWIATNRYDLSAEQVAAAYKLRWDIGVSSQGRIIQSVKVRPRLKDSGPRSLEGAVARKQDGKALRQHSLKGGCATYQVVTCSERRCSLVTRIPVAETVDNARRQQEMAVMSRIRYFSPAGYQRRHGMKDYAETGEALDVRRRNFDEEFRPITVSGKWREWRQGGGSGRSTFDLCAAKRTGREGPGPADIPFWQSEAGVR